MSGIGFLLCLAVAFVSGWFLCSYFEAEGRRRR